MQTVLHGRYQSSIRAAKQINHYIYYFKLGHINVTYDAFSGAHSGRCGPMGFDVIMSHTTLLVTLTETG